jgi:hypothetical protein
MMTLIPNLPSNTVGVKATGEITKEDFNSVVMPAVDALGKRTDKINYLLLLETDISHFEPGAWIKDAIMGFKHLFKWNKVAIVTDQKAVEKFTDIFSYAVPGEYKGFSTTELEEAKAWVSAPDRD